ncbi:aldo/keto reductase [Hyphococcus flavus]|uniref:Aldo/keto reductase n=1 Tax=Hyphococcus flavus TaxID=1866326 RepID=A0AAF0CGR5_9PROT|nr:aldo/keto reductase [Hyphococcus flavus]WDI32518.1 aldo/keto reductase [Hyphococcus flavus]
MINRRMVVAALASAPLAPKLASAQPARLHKTIPSTGETVPAVGMGTWLTFDVGANAGLRRTRLDVTRTFFELGGAIIDSSPMYGSSQDVLGYALENLVYPSQLFAADKVWIRGGENGPAQVAQTRRRWGVESFDLLQVHNLVSWRAHLDTLFSMKAEGRLRYVGVTSYAGLRYSQIEAIMNEHPLDFIQITYNLVDRAAENRLLPLAQEKGIAVIANRPFRESQLIDAAMRRPLPEMAADIGAQNWAQFLLKFIISHPAITAAIPATRRVDHMRENMGALTGPMPDAAFRQQMAEEATKL